MAKVEKMVIVYDEGGCSEYQPCRIAAEITVVLEEGDEPMKVFRSYYNGLKERISPLVTERVEELVARKRERNWR